MKVPISRVSLLETEISSVLEPLKSGWLVQGKHVADFEEKWNSFTGSEESVAVTSCTSALHLSLAALGIGPGDEVIVPAFTWISSANVVEHLGARVVFCDIDERTFNLDPSAIEAKVTSFTRAIIPVHLFGYPAQMDEIMALAKSFRLWVIEDAACGFGTSFAGQHVGTFGHTGCFSFHPRKALTTGEGGMITTSDKALAKRLRRLRDHGADTSDFQRHLGPRPYLLPEFPDAGYNQRMTDIQAALGSAQMDRADNIVSERRALADRYNIAFETIEWLETPFEEPGSFHSYQSYACMFQPERVLKAIQNRDARAVEDIKLERDEWMDQLNLKGISTRPGTQAVHMLEYYRKKYSLSPGDFFRAYAAYSCSISLPLFTGMTPAEQSYVIDAVLSRH